MAAPKLRLPAPIIAMPESEKKMAEALAGFLRQLDGDYAMTDNPAHKMTVTLMSS